MLSTECSCVFTDNEEEANKEAIWLQDEISDFPIHVISRWN